MPKDLSVRWHSCSRCGAELDRDENAARNLLRRYEEQGPLLTSKKRMSTRRVAGAGSAPQCSAASSQATERCRSSRL
ncbi:transposase [Ktedonospora formicarum]|uniref:transposase n=1 Tax=Ktedonospora formicarum TaxID=2778364 RepID=UPI001F41D4A1|nr:transposase [Ktedonospora formicarum]